MKKPIFLVIILVIILVGGWIIHKRFLSNFPTASAKQPILVSISKPVEHSSHLFDPNFFTQAYSLGNKYEKQSSTRVFGGIIPHHLLAAPLIAGFFEGIKDQQISTVILLSPNHYGVGPYNISTSEGVWTTVFGNLETNTSKVSQLERDKAAFVSERLFDTEHGIYGITPFIKKTFPNAKFVPIVIKAYTPQSDCDTLISSLIKIVDSQTIVIVSSDFSHYLPSSQADLHDKESIADIEAFNIDKVFHIDDVKNIDSPGSVYILLKLMQLEGATNPLFIENTNSAKLTNDLDISSTTSYLTMYFTK